jgi:hypothetical protein
VLRVVVPAKPGPVVVRARPAHSVATATVRGVRACMELLLSPCIGLSQRDVPAGVTRIDG